MSQTLWVCGQMMADPTQGTNWTPAWDIIGVFSTEAGARAMCTTLAHFVGPVTLDQATLIPTS